MADSFDGRALKAGWVIGRNERPAEPAQPPPGLRYTRIMGTSVGMIEAHYGALIDTAHDSILTRLERTG